MRRDIFFEQSCGEKIHHQHYTTVRLGGPRRGKNILLPWKISITIDQIQHILAQE